MVKQSRAQRLAQLNRQRQRMEDNNTFNPLPDLSPRTIIAITVALAAVFVMYKPGMRRPDFQQWPAKMHVEAREGYTGLVYDKRVGYALQVLRDVPPNRSLIEVPYSACIDVTTVDNSVIGKKWLTEHADIIAKELGDDEALVDLMKLIVFVIVHGRQADFSPWYDWIHDTISTTTSAEAQWGVKMVSRCLSDDAKAVWEQTVMKIGRIHNCIIRLTQASEDFVEFTREVDFNDVGWAYTVVKSRGWVRPSPRRLMLVPLIDRADMRANVHQKRTNPQKLNSAAFFDDESEMVHLLSVGHIKKGGLALTSYGKHMFPTEALRLYGFVDKTFSVFQSYASFLPAEGDAPVESMAKAGCYDARNLFFYRNGTPSAVLFGCAQKHYGETKAPQAMLDHITTVLDTVHSTAKYERCLDLQQQSYGETGSIYREEQGIEPFLELENLLREAFTRAQLFFSQYVKEE